ncbi:MAG: helix-turn-helix domain-containing protein [Firmicutes bacterium]|nr:helix-turn-helix domain-containing protein [Bacillota bacterium]
MKAFGDKLRELMDEKEINQKQLCTLTGLRPASVSEYLSGIHEPSTAKKRMIAEALGVPETYFGVAVSRNGKIASNSMSVETAAKLMGKSVEFVKRGLRDGVFPWGYAVKMSRDWNYWINPRQFERIEGIKVLTEDEGGDEGISDETTTKN